MSTVRTVIAVGLAVFAIYFSWAWWRWDLWDIAHDARWPHGWPFPDRGLMALERYFDRSHPGRIKLHGEFARVRWTVGVAAISCGAVGFLFGWPAIRRWLGRGRLTGRGFSVLSREP